MDKLIINANRDAYFTRDIISTMTVGDLRSFLEDFEDSTPIYISFDRGYTFGALKKYNFDIEYGEEY